MARFDSFVVLAGMRTGSNALEVALAALPGVVCRGELFNTAFIGAPGRDRVAGWDMVSRAADPAGFWQAMRAASDGLTGFRYFDGHEPRIFDVLMDDPTCAKIVLTRNPLDSYISLRIARATDQWVLTDAKDRKTTRPTFDADGFAAHAERAAAFQARIRRALQVRGQTAFPVAYEDIGSVEVVNGLAAWLGVEGRLKAWPGRLKRQNPGPRTEKVANPDQMRAALARMDPWALDAAPPPEPALGPAVPSFVAAPETPVMVLPIAGAPGAEVRRWLAALDGVEEDALRRGFTEKSLRQWKNRAKDARTFAVVTHPVVRLHRVFCRRILAPGVATEARAALIDGHGVALPDGKPGADWTVARHREAFLAFLRFAQANLAGQTGLPPNPALASQSAILAGFAQAVVPDMVLREDQLSLGLSQLAAQVGREAPPPPAPVPEDAPHPLAAIYDDAVEDAVRAMHNRDFMAFGFRRWSRHRQG